MLARDRQGHIGLYALCSPQPQSLSPLWRGRRDWLSGLITNEIGENVTFAALLTPQGKIIADFFIYRESEELLLDTPTKFGEMLHKRLRMYRLRAPIEIEATELSVYADWDRDGYGGHPDPRHARIRESRHLSEGLRRRATMTRTASHSASQTANGTSKPQTVFPADANMDLLNGVNFSKGCFVGQEVVSRMKRMTTVKKRLRGIIFEGSAKAGDRVLAGERVIGDVLHHERTDGHGHDPPRPPSGCDHMG